MDRCWAFLSGRLHSADQQIGHHTDVIRNHAPVDLRVEVRTRLPVATENIKSPLQIRDDGLHPAPPFLKARLHVQAAGQILQRSDDLVEDDVDDPGLLCRPLVRKRRIPSVRRHIARDNAVVLFDPRDDAAIGLCVPRIAVQYLAVDDQGAYTRRQVDLMAEGCFPSPFDEDVGVLLVNREQLLFVRYLLAQNLMPIRHGVDLLGLRQKGQNLSRERMRRFSTMQRQRGHRSLPLIDGSAQQLQLLLKKLFATLFATLFRFRVVDLPIMLFRLLLVPPYRDRSPGLFPKLHQQPIKCFDAIPHQRIVRRIVDVRLHSRGVTPRLAEILKSFRLGHFVDGNHDLLKRLGPDHGDVLLPDRKGDRIPPPQLDKKRADARIMLGVLQLPIGQTLHLFIERASQDLFDRRSVLPTQPLALFAVKVRCDDLNDFRVHRQDRIKHRKLRVDRPVRILKRQRQFVQKLHRSSLLISFPHYTFPTQNQQVECLNTDSK